MLNYYYKASINEFLRTNDDSILGILNRENQFDGARTQINSWDFQIPFLKLVLQRFDGTIFFEFSIPRMGKRIDVLLIINDIVFVLEFKVGESKYHQNAISQVWDYALDLKNFHKPSHNALMAPILIATDAIGKVNIVKFTSHNDNLLNPMLANSNNLGEIIEMVLNRFGNSDREEINNFERGAYHPTPSIIETAIKLYNNHNVSDIIRNEAENLSLTTGTIGEVIDFSKSHSFKSICFVTGVPGAGKTLVGLKVATEHLDNERANKSVYLSGNGPLVMILQEALARDQVLRIRNEGERLTKAQAKSEVKLFIQNIHHYRDEYLVKPEPPYDHVAIFDEAQRAWNKEQTVSFMKQKKGRSDFDMSEPEFLISCLDRHKDWAVIVCLVGGGQEINTGEAGISEWLKAIDTKYPNWKVFISPNLEGSEYNANHIIQSLGSQSRVHLKSSLHLSVSMRSFRAESVSYFVKTLLERKTGEANSILSGINQSYPIVLTRDLSIAKEWLKEKSRGTERYGLVVSSQAYRLKPFAIDVKSPMDPVHWFLGGKEDVRSSFYLEDVATEFQVQGLELDYVCVAWDGDLRYSQDEWRTFSFKGNKWQNINKEEKKRYLINAYRVLLTRARQGMVIVVPEGDANDHTRKPEYYDDTFHFLKGVGITTI